MAYPLSLAFFAVIVFMPVFLQSVTGASATESGFLLLPLLLAATLSTALSGRVISKTGRYKRFPVIGFGLMTTGLVVLAVVAGERSREPPGVRSVTTASARRKRTVSVSSRAATWTMSIMSQPLTHGTTPFNKKPPSVSRMDRPPGRAPARAIPPRTCI